MDAALSKNGRRTLRGFFGLVVVFLYAPIVVLLVFSFNSSALPAFPLGGFTLHWYGEFLHNGDLRGALETSAIVAAVSSLCAVLLGLLASLALARRSFRGKGAASALLLSPLVIPVVVLGISLLLLFHALGIPRSLLTVVIGHVVISLPYTILVLVPRLQQVESALEEAAYDFGAGPFATFRTVTLPLVLPAVVSAFLIAFTTSFDEYLMAAFLSGNDATLPVYIFSQLRFPNRLTGTLALGSCILVISFAIVTFAEWMRRRGVNPDSGMGI